MHIRRHRRLSRGSAVRLPITEQLQPRLDMWVGRVKLCSPLVGIERVTDLVVTGFILDSRALAVVPTERTETSSTYQSAKIIPHLGYEGVEPNSSRIGIQCVPILVDLIVKHTNRAPKGRVPAVTVHGLLIGLVSFGVLLL